MNKKNILSFVSCFLLGVPFYAQQVFSLKESIDYSLKNHGSNVIYANEVKIAKNKSKEALADYLPQVSGSFSLDDNIKRQTTVLPGAMFGSDKDVEVQFGNKFNSMAIIQLDQTIYDQALIYGIKAGVPAKKIAELKLQKNNEDLIYNTATAYSQILLLKEQQKMLVANEKQYNDLYAITKFRLEKGVAKKVDLDRVTVQLNDIKAKQKQIQTSINVAYASLKNEMGMPQETSFVIEESLDYSKYLQFTDESLDVRNLIDYKLQSENIALKEIDVKRKQAAYLPTITGYIRNGQQAFGNELDAAVSNWKNFSAIGLKANVPIFSGMRKDAQLQQSRLELVNAKEDFNLNIGKFELQFQNANKQLQENIATLNSNKSNMDLSKSVYETGVFEYNKGVSLLSDLLNADFSYQQAQSNYMSSLLNLVANRLLYERAKGTISSFVNQL
ncbi:TolC family protein [Flavobacterium palustre]|uniref:TolC family protein n=1 Tax=Flavobacterium palustre TaxID=1476463 RepID=UPI00166D97E2|nr:TolC family protein [Flavobacterium palustre]